ncbi:MAG: glycosyltransferase family 1 protein [Pseudorhodoplanes sp.]|nr:glycosyltransferase family 1 protein [Pseudorhodoplanes sp.]MCQ3943091.1 glycosyltransferase family 1 protein [Alphaproteobacteria bacterium]GIK79424.1 MAG: GDP-mannose-dependent alpha-mannosyltransferase [Alphaproteobacteria bacterium]
MDAYPPDGNGRAGAAAGCLKKVLVATDAWYPQVNGVVRTLTSVARVAQSLGTQIVFVTPQEFHTVPLPTYPDIRLALPPPRAIAGRIHAERPDFIHVATEGPIGHMVSRYCRRHGLAFTTSFHTRFPDYVSARAPIPRTWVWAWLRRFHRRGAGVMAATPRLASELLERGFHNVMLWPRGVDADLFRPARSGDLALRRPIFLTVGRVALEKNIEAFLSLDLPGTKVVVGDGPARAELERRFPDAVFLGAKQGEELARIYAAADVFVFPSKTDTFGLVLLEALASGVPVAAFPVAAPRDVIGDAAIGALDWDLGRACLRALTLSRQACRSFALGMTWEASARCFLSHIARFLQAGDKAVIKPTSNGR